MIFTVLVPPAAPALPPLLLLPLPHPAAIAAAATIAPPAASLLRPTIVVLLLDVSDWDETKRCQSASCAESAGGRHASRRRSNTAMRPSAASATIAMITMAANTP